MNVAFFDRSLICFWCQMMIIATSRATATTAASNDPSIINWSKWNNPLFKKFILWQQTHYYVVFLLVVYTTTMNSTLVQCLCSSSQKFISAGWLLLTTIHVLFYRQVDSSRRQACIMSWSTGSQLLNWIRLAIINSSSTIQCEIFVTFVGFNDRNKGDRVSRSMFRADNTFRLGQMCSCLR